MFKYTPSLFELITAFPSSRLIPPVFVKTKSWNTPCQYLANYS
jgi:hypothetical protein